MVIWGATFLITGDEIRAQSAPIELTRFAPDLTVVDQSAAFVQMRLRGSTWALDSTNAVRLTVRADLRELGDGVHTVDVTGPWPALPRGVELDELSPQRVTIRLARTPDIGAHSNERR